MRDLLNLQIIFYKGEHNDYNWKYILRFRSTISIRNFHCK